MTQINTVAPVPQQDLQTVVQSRTREWHFHIYFLLQSPDEKAAALALRDAVLRLRRDGKSFQYYYYYYYYIQAPAVKLSLLTPLSLGAFVAVPLHRVNEYPIGPHPAGSYEIWVPDSSFSDVFFYLATNRGDLSVLIHPLTEQQRRDHESRNGWLGRPWPIYLDGLPQESDEVPFQYPELRLGWSSAPETEISLEERRKRGAEVEALLANDPDAASAPAN